MLIMNTGFGRRLENPVGLANIQLCDYYNEGKIITRVHVPKEHRRKGIGSELLEECCKMADATGTTLYLEIGAYEEVDYDTLELWYQAFAFKAWNGIYRRLPKRGE